VQRLLLGVGLLAGCALHAEVPVESASATATLSGGGACAAPPIAQRGRFRSVRNRVYAKLGEPRHRGIDLIALDTDATQTIAGKLAYSAADKDLAHEDVTLYACVDASWHPLVTVRTDRDGRFSHDLVGPLRLPAGTRDLFASVAGDGTGVRFLASVATAGESVIVTDIDGTITASENAILNTLLFGDDIGHRLDAPRVLASSGHKVVYMSARGDQLSDVTRRWLRGHGFPDGPLRLARKAITSPGPKTVAFKTAALRSAGVRERRRPRDAHLHEASGVRGRSARPARRPPRGGVHAVGRAPGALGYASVSHVDRSLIAVQPTPYDYRWCCSNGVIATSCWMPPAGSPRPAASTRSRGRSPRSFAS
jgi:hypothetical protein